MSLKQKIEAQQLLTEQKLSEYEAAREWLIELKAKRAFCTHLFNAHVCVHCGADQRDANS